MFVSNVGALDFQAEAIIEHYTTKCVLVDNSSGWSNMVVFDMSSS